MTNTAEWHEERKLGLGGSDSPVVLGVNPWKTPYDLWLEKTDPNYLEDPDLAQKPDIQRGQWLEAIAATIYADKTGRDLRPESARVHPVHSWMRGNIDRRITSLDQDGVLEIKCPRVQTFSKIKREGLPDYYTIQGQHYCEVMGLDWCSFAVFSADRWELLWFDMERDQGLIDLIVEKGAEFWRLVETNTPPDVFSEPAVDLPPVGGELISINDRVWAEAVDELREASELAAEAKAIEEAAKGRIQRLMAANGTDVAEGAGLRVYWKEQAGRKTLDKKALKKAHPEIDLDVFMKVGKPSRPFRPYFLKSLNY